MKHTQGGFILKVMLVVVGACIAFIVLSTLAHSLGQGAGFGAISTAGPSPAPAASTESKATNPLLQFLDDSGNSSYSSSGDSSVPAYARSPYAGAVSLGTGNTYSIQPFEEYLTLRNYGRNSVNVTGWTVTNGKGTRPIQTRENDYVYPVADSATIGQGTEFLDPLGGFNVGPIVMRPGDSAILSTGRPFSQFPFSITTNFRENICDGYLKEYPFTPALTLACPVPTSDSEVRTVTSECYDYMNSLYRCEDPVKYDKKGYDSQTGQCRSFMDARLSYPACVASNKNRSGFSTNQWRIFLGKTRELWAAQKETITLYDARGLIVDQISY